MRFLLILGAIHLGALSNLSAADHRPLQNDSADIKRPAVMAGRVAVAAAQSVPPQEGASVAYSREDICDTLIAAAQAHDLPIGFFARLIWQESGFKTEAVSPAGALGIAQFMPGVAAEMGIDDPFDPAQALPASARFLRALHRQFGNHGLAAAAYNAGSRRVSDWLAKRGKLPNETRSYVLNITGRPPEQWIGAKHSAANLAVPLGTRCQQLAAPILVTQAARWAKQAVRVRAKRASMESPPSADVAVLRPDTY